MFQRVAEFHRAFGLSIADTPALPDQATRDLRIRLLKEEVDEFHMAFHANDEVEMADALADICYIIAGTVVCYGIGPKAEDRYKSPYDRYLPNEYARKHCSIIELLSNTFIDYEIAEHGDNLSAIDLTLMNMLTGVFGIAWRLDIPLNAVFAEVHRSNLSKVLPDGSVLRREDGKVIKPKNWSPPDIAAILGTRYV